jgi:sarcosine oxidase
MNTSFDVIVVGLGADGSAAAYHLARSGQRVLGLDRFAPPHTLGATHGGSRIIRKAYFEGPQYLPLLERAYGLWRDLEAASQTPLLTLCGCLNIGRPGRAIVEGARRSAEAIHSPYEVLSREAVQRRFPAFHLPEGHVAVFEAEAGLVDPEQGVRAHLAQARRHGAVLHFDEPATAWQSNGEGVAVTTARATYRADRLILCGGGWTTDLLADLRLPLRVERVTNAWFRPTANAAHFDPARCPVYIWEYEPDKIVYGFPDLGDGVKAGLHYDGTLVDHPDAVQRMASDADARRVRAVLRRLLPDADGPLTNAAVCFYTNTPDKHYLIDRHPAYPHVAFASACSGHGFKASNAVGEALADLVMGRTPEVDIEAFRLRRFDVS